MPKATTADVKNQGFKQDMFRMSDSGAAFDTYLAGYIAMAGNWAEAKIGAAVYAATTAGYAFDCIVRAEVCYTASQLWSARVAFSDSAALTSLQSPEYLNRREYLAHRDSALECAYGAMREALTALGLDTSALNDTPALASGMIETGPFPPVTEARLNV